MTAPRPRWPALGLSLLLTFTAPAFGADQDAPQLQAGGRWSANQIGSAATPPMGWNSWNAFRTEINEEKVMGAAQALVSTGLSKLGYVYVNIDDGWWLKRRATDGRMEIRTNIFPSARVEGQADTSFRPFVDRIHALGLKAGIYTDIGRNACSQAHDLHSPNLPQGSVREREVGLEGFVDQDMRLYFQDWGFDYIKIDACGLADFGRDAPALKKASYRARTPLIVRPDPAQDHSATIRSMYEQAAASIRSYRKDEDFVLSICTWGRGEVRTWGHQVGNAWRTAPDIDPNWQSMLSSFDSVATRAFYARPGSWNDPDMLYLGAGDFDSDHLTEARSHFSLWAIINAPLLIGFDLRGVSPALLDIWGNADVVAVSQDRLGNQGVVAARDGDVEVIVKTLANGRKAVALLNRGQRARQATLRSADLKFDADAPITLRDLWSKQSLPAFHGATRLTLAPRQTLLFEASGSALLPRGVYLSEIPARLHVAHEAPGAPRGGVVPDAGPDGRPLRVGATTFRHGVGMLANTRVEVRADGEFAQFHASVGVGKGAAPVRFAVYGDGRLLRQTRAMKAGQRPLALSADIQGVRVVELIATGPGAAQVTWGDARLLRPE